MTKDIIGIDEVGRGCWAGPLLVVAARAISNLPNGLKDSKKLSKKRRQLLKYDIEISCQLGEGWVYPHEIDQIGLSNAMRLATSRALESIGATNEDTIIFDGSINYCDTKYINVQTVIKADDSHPIVSAASIYAKVTRDSYMENLTSEYSKYYFDRHLGYGTKLHREMLDKYGASDIHRMSFAPIKALA